jgi:hypothetical protein
MSRKKPRKFTVSTRLKARESPTMKRKKWSINERVGGFSWHLSTSKCFLKITGIYKYKQKINLLETTVAVDIKGRSTKFALDKCGESAAFILEAEQVLAIFGLFLGEGNYFLVAQHLFNLKERFNVGSENKNYLFFRWAFISACN